MKQLYFNQNHFLEKNNFLKELKKEISKMFHNYFKENSPIPTNFEEFDKQISNLIIQILDNQDAIKKKRLIQKVKCTTTKKWKSKKFIR